MWLFLIFVAVPIIEIALFINLGGWLGTFPTLAIIVITAALGTFLVKTQAISTFKTIGTKFRSLQNPTEPYIFDWRVPPKLRNQVLTINQVRQVGESKAT